MSLNDYVLEAMAKAAWEVPVRQHKRLLPRWDNLEQVVRDEAIEEMRVALAVYKELKEEEA